MILFSLFQWDSTSHKGKINSKWELCILQHLYTIILPSPPLYTSPSGTNNGANLLGAQRGSSFAPRLAEQFYLFSGNRRLLRVLISPAHTGAYKWKKNRTEFPGSGLKCCTGAIMSDVKACHACVPAFPGAFSLPSLGAGTAMQVTVGCGLSQVGPSWVETREDWLLQLL